MDWIVELEGTVVGIDTAPLIYYVEEHPRYLPVIDPFFAALARFEFQVVTSMISLAECLVHPLRSGNTALANAYRDLLLNTAGITSVPVTPAIAERTAQLRASYHVRTPDAIWIASELHYGATVLVTNDNRLPADQG